MHPLKNDRTSVAFGALVLAISTSVYGEDAGAQAAAATPPANPPAASAGTAAAPKAAIHFEGTDLHLRDLPPISFHGFASQGFLASTDYNYMGNTTRGSFEFNEFALNASMSPFNRTRIAAQAFLFDMGNVGNYQPSLDYGLIDYSFCDEFGVRGGRVRRPMGIYNHILDVDLARTSVLLPQGLYDARWRDFSASIDGGSLYGNVNLGKAGGLSYEVYGGMINLAQDGGVARWAQNGLPPAPIGSLDAVAGNVVAGAQLWWNTPVQGLRAGAALGEAVGLTYDVTVIPPFGPGGMHAEINNPFQQYSLEYVWRSWTFQAEYQTMNQLEKDSVGGNVVGQSRVRGDAWYLGAAYRFNKWLEAGTYYTEAYPDVSNRSGDGRATPSDAFQKDVALSLRFDPKPWWIIKAEGHFLRGTSLLRDNVANPTRDGDGWWMLALKTTFSF